MNEAKVGELKPLQQAVSEIDIKVSVMPDGMVLLSRNLSENTGSTIRVERGFTMEQLGGDVMSLIVD